MKWFEKITTIKLKLFSTSSQQFKWFWPKKKKTFMLTSLLISLIVIYGSIIAPAITNSYASVFDVIITVYIMGVVCMMLSLIILNTFLIGSLCEHFTQVIHF